MEPGERSTQAGEYVLGTLTADERRAFEQAAANDSELRREQYAWEVRLAPLAQRLPPVAPRPLVWLDLAHRIGGAAPAAPRRGSRFLKTWASLATAASLVLAFGLYREATRPLPAPVVERVEVPVPAQTFVALLQVPQSSLQWTVSVAPERGQLAVRAGGEVPGAARERDAELWLITDAGPVSLGVLPKTGEMRRALPAGLAFAAGKTVAVSLEPPGGSPTGQPTGPVITTAAMLQAS